MSVREKKILVSGNPKYGLAEALSSVLAADFVSRSNGYDLSTIEGQERLVQLSHGYDAFVNLASLSEFAQVNLLQKVWTNWQNHKRAGHILSIGSTLDRWLSSGDRIYAVEKAALQRLSNQLALATHGKSQIRVSLVSLGMLATPGMQRKFPEKNKMDLTQAATIIKWALDCPEGLNINEISIDPIQPTLLNK